ncbi:hypothetical protein [Legionella micdadei]|uniref:Uncharacterized protein n=1 Tax=Legionella micdadei TaxID=451 RepID=A0A098GEP3_LEGMI|nr:hypothetical protein [Legionella micdadei]KTD27572.1 hypothetical protein Lmic_1892 [Legionella micdadei]CEG60939.1 protein of unknown function [Legionella micdadei]SCY69241.1 hypothetical protein SAMN02982997_02510 [Legionella micdadei]
MAFLTDSECKKIIFNIGRELNLPPKLISTRLLDDFDKDAMREGLLEISILKRFVEVWRDMGMPDQVLK